MKTLYTNNVAGAEQAARDFCGEDRTSPTWTAHTLIVQHALRGFGVVRVRELKGGQIAAYITKLGFEVFEQGRI